MFVRRGIYFQADSPTGAIEPPADGDPFPKSWDEIFKHPRFKELNTKAQQATAELERIKAEEKTKQDEALKEQNKWKELFDGKEKELSQRNIELLRLKTLTAKIMPDDSKEYLTLIDRLRGETAEEIEKDADSLLALVKPATKDSKGLPRTRTQQQTSLIDLQTETDPAKIRAAVRAGTTQ